MNVESYRDYCMAKAEVTESFPFDKSTLVFKVLGKMFALSNVDKFEFINLKCDPEYAIELREKYTEIRPGYHMNKKLWNSVYTDGVLSDKMIKSLIDDSYNLIIAKLPKKERDKLL